VPDRCEALSRPFTFPGCPTEVRFESNRYFDDAAPDDHDLDLRGAIQTFEAGYQPKLDNPLMKILKQFVRA